MRKKTAKHMCYLALSAVPLLLAWCFFRLYSQGSLFEVVPYSHYDPFDYFLQINGVAAQGFRMGHFSQNEVLPYFQTSPFGAHGPFYVVLIGFFAKFFG